MGGCGICCGFELFEIIPVIVLCKCPEKEVGERAGDRGVGEVVAEEDEEAAPRRSTSENDA
jgi:hypothetical protein